MKFFLPTLFCFAILMSCSKNSGDTGGGGTGGGGGSSCSGTPGPLFNAVKTILAANCAVSGCHAGASPQNGINFGDNCTIVAQASRIKARAVDGNPSVMPPPPNPPLTTSEKNAITAWVNAGGKLSD